ncbi:hypothetical protein CPB85DRAFT_1221168 [Mucidula mucida]|nr:hypothetical protein CPB85DRAFT_1221168 [Mucidula mucida]
MSFFVDAELCLKSSEFNQRNLKSAVLRVQGPVAFTSIPRRAISSFYEHSSGKWLYNDTERELRVARYSPFNVQELYKTASESVGARECTSMVKFSEAADSCSKVFRMTFDNGRTAIARMPLPRLLGNVSSVIASEVATAEFCRDIGLFGVPKVYAWSKDPSNPVGSAYIITEDVIGTPLSDEWTSLRGEPLENAITTIALNLLTLQIIKFSQLGSLYFKDDLPSELQCRPLFHNSFKPSLFPDALAEKLWAPSQLQNGGALIMMTQKEIEVHVRTLYPLSFMSDYLHQGPILGN